MDGATRPKALVGLAIAYSPNFISVLLCLAHFPWHPRNVREGIMLVTYYKWFAAGALLLFILVGERRGLGSIGLKRMRLRDAVVVVIGVAATFVLSAVLIAAWGHTIPSGSGTRVIERLPLAMRLHLVLNVAVTEEILFRGYPIERIEWLTGRTWLAAGISWALFTFLHYPFFDLRTVVVGTAPGALVLTLIYVWRRNLPTNMVVHLLLDLPILFLR